MRSSMKSTFKSPKEHYDHLEGIYKRGLAFGEADIHNDEMTFRFRNELYTFPSMVVYPGIAKYNGYFYEAKVSDLRQLAKGKH